MTKSEEEVPENHPTVTKIMTPKLEEESENHPSVVSVVGNSSLRAPNSSSVPDVAKALRAGKDLTTSSTRYPNGHLGLPLGQGHIKADSDAACFDAGFFGLSHKQAEAMDPLKRKLLEISHEVLLDGSSFC